MSALVEGAARLQIELTDAQLARLDQLGAALREGNRRVNLTRIVDPAEIETRHFLDSLSAALPLLDRLRPGASRAPDRRRQRRRHARPAAQDRLSAAAASRLVESIGKKAAFLRETVEQLGLQRRPGRRRPRRDRRARSGAPRRVRLGHRARAGPLPVVVELCAPFLAPGGLLVAQRSGDLDAQLLQAAPAFKALHLWSRTPIWVDLPGLDGQRGLIVGEKYAPTPERYPRRPGIPRKRPLS